MTATNNPQPGKAKSTATAVTSGAAAHILPDEPNWGNPEKSQVRRDVSKGEIAAGIAWLSIGSLASLAIEVLYLDTRVPVGNLSVPFPWTVVFAGLFGLVLSRTALLWTDKRGIAGIPFAVWLLGFFTLPVASVFSAQYQSWLPEIPATVFLLVIGCFGFYWPLRPNFAALDS